MNKADILKQRQAHRGDPQELILGFALNYSGPARLMHFLLPANKGKLDILQTAMRAYVIGIAACVETFFRDLYLFMLQGEPALVSKALAENGLRESASNLPKYLASGISAEEFAAGQVSFQSSATIDKNFTIFFPEPFFDAVDKFELVCDVPSSRRPGETRLKMMPGWKTDIDRVFTLRHDFAHDANSTTKVTFEEMRSIETTALIFCQLTGWLVKHRSKRLFTSRNFPAVLLISDLIAEDWEISDDPPSLSTEHPHSEQ